MDCRTAGLAAGHQGRIHGDMESQWGTLSEAMAVIYRELARGAPPRGRWRHATDSP